MGQQESRGGSPAQAKRPADRSAPGTPGGGGGEAGPTRGRRMEKLFRRAQSTLNARTRERLTTSSGRDGEDQSSGSSMEGSPAVGTGGRPPEGPSPEGAVRAALATNGEDGSLSSEGSQESLGGRGMATDQTPEGTQHMAASKPKSYTSTAETGTFIALVASGSSKKSPAPKPPTGASQKAETKLKIQKVTPTSIPPLNTGSLAAPVRATGTDADGGNGDYVRLMDLDKLKSKANGGSTLSLGSEDLTPTQERLAEGVCSLSTEGSPNLKARSSGLTRDQIVRESHPIYSRKSGSKTSSMSSLTSVSSTSDYEGLTVEDVQVEVKDLRAGQQPHVDGILDLRDKGHGHQRHDSDNPDLARLEQSIREGMRAVIGLQQLNSQREAELRRMQEKMGTARNGLDRSNDNTLTLPSSAGSSLLSSPCDDVFVDAVNGSKTPTTPSESPYMSATEGHHGGRGVPAEQTTTSPESPESPLDQRRPVKRKSARRRSKTEPSEVDDLASRKSCRSVSMENLDSGERRHKPVETAYTVKTSRVLSSSSQDSSTSGPNKEYDQRTYAQRRKNTGSALDLRSGRQDTPMSQQSYQAPRPKHSLSLPSGLDQRQDDDVIITDMAKVSLNFNAQDLILQDAAGLRGESSTDRMVVSDMGPNLFSAPSTGRTEGRAGRRHRSVTGDSAWDRSNSRTSQHPSTLPSSFKKRPKYAGDAWSSPTSPTEGSAPGGPMSGFRRPPSRSVSLEEAVTIPMSVPEKLDFKQLEKFEGESLKTSNDYQISLICMVWIVISKM